MKLNRVLVAGHKGFIGSRLWKRQGFQWVGVDLKEGKDICDYKVDSSCEVIILLASRLDHNAKMFQHNLKIYYWLCSVLEKSPNIHVIFTSSAAVYGDFRTDQVEYAPLMAPTIYGMSKLLGENIIQALAKKYTILRLANVYGDGDGNGVIDKFKNGEKTIYGNGNNIRDYIYVERVCDVIENILKRPHKYRNRTYNISTGTGQSVKAVFKKYGRGIPKYVQPRKQDVKYSVLDNSRAKKEGLLV